MKDGGYVVVNVSQLNHGEILKGRKILITGGSSGIGLAIAKKCLSEGAEVVITGRNADKLHAVSEGIGNPLLHTLEWDVSDIGIIQEKLDKVSMIINGRLDVLVNNAGILMPKAFREVTEEIWDKTYSINSKGLFFLSQAICNRWIKETVGGKIINISSSGGFLAAHYPYRMTKWDIVGFTHGLGLKFYKDGIIVNGIAPGMTASEIIRVDTDKNAYVDYPPSNRVSLPEEVAELAVFMISDAANNIVGQTIVCDGGYSLHG